MPPQGSFGAYTDEDFDKPRTGRRWLKRSFFLLLAIAVIGGGLYGGYRWTQTQYYVGSKDQHVALYRGISQDLAWVSLSEVEKDHPEIELKYLPAYQRKQVEETIAGGNLPKAQTKIQELSLQASACKKSEQRRQAAADAADKASTPPPTTGTAAPSTAPSTKPTAAAPSPGPTLSEDEQKLASNCGKQ